MRARLCKSEMLPAMSFDLFARVTVTFPGSPCASSLTTLTIRVRRFTPSSSSTTRTISPGQNREKASPVSRWRSIAPIS